MAIVGKSWTGGMQFQQGKVGEMGWRAQAQNQVRGDGKVYSGQDTLSESKNCLLFLLLIKKGKNKNIGYQH